MLKEILDYVGLEKLDETNDYSTILESLKCTKPRYKIISNYDDSNIFKIYKTIKIKDIDILISNTDRTTDIKERYDSAKPINEIIIAYKELWNELISKAKIEKIEEIEEIQNKLKLQKPFFIKYKNNFEWQIFYSKDDNKYFMLFPANEGDSSSLFYLIKKKMENRLEDSIFIPISRVEYSENVLKASEIDDLETYLFNFTRNWATTYEVTEIEKNTKLEIIGNTKLEERFDSKFKIILNDSNDGLNYYTLVKALYILDTETDLKGKFELKIGENGSLYFLYNNKMLTMDNLPNFINEIYNEKLEKKNSNIKQIENNKKEIENLKIEIDKLTNIYKSKEKIIVLFLDCKKSFFKKIKFYIKGGKKLSTDKFNKKSEKRDLNTHVNLKNLDKVLEQPKESKNNEINNAKNKKELVYNISDIVKINKENLENENDLKFVNLDKKSLEIKKANLERKIKNAQDYINEIEKHKKNIFDFWKFTNKDKINELQEGITIDKQNSDILKKFSYDLENEFDIFANDIDKLQKRKLSIEEENSIFISQYVLDSINSVINIQNSTEKAEIDEIEKELKNQLDDLKRNNLINVRENILGNIMDDYTKVKNLNNKKHRENEKSLESILKITKSTTIDDFKNLLIENINYLKDALTKIKSITDLDIYLKGDITEKSKYYLADINPINLIEYNCKKEQKIYKIHINKDDNILFFSNIIYFDNFNQTLPNGMDVSTKVLIELPKEQKFNSFKDMNIIIENSNNEAKIQKIHILKRE